MKVECLKCQVEVETESSCFSSPTDSTVIALSRYTVYKFEKLTFAVKNWQTLLFLQTGIIRQAN